MPALVFRPVFAAGWRKNLLISDNCVAFSQVSGRQQLEMKRRPGESKFIEKPSKRIKPDDYCNVEMKRNFDGDPIWPAAFEQMQAAQAFIKEW